MEALLEIFIEEAVHDWVGEDRGHGGQVAHGEDHQQQLVVGLSFLKK